MAELFLNGGEMYTLEDLKAESNSESKGNNEFNDALKNCVSQG